MINRKIPLICETCHCLQLLLEKTPLNSFQSFAELFVGLFWLADERVTPKESSSEDVKVYSIEAAYDLVKYSTLSVIQEALEDELFTRALGHAVSVLVSLPLKSPSKSLQISSVKTLEILLIRSHSVISVCPEDAKKNKSRIIRGVWKSFLPGISISLFKLLTLDDKHPQGLVVCCLSVLTLVVTASFSLCLEEDILREKETEDFTKTCENLQTILSKLVSLLITSQWTSVRTSLLSTSTSLVTDTAQTFSDQLQDILFGIPITLSMDTNEGIRSKASTFITSYLKKDDQLRDMIHEKLESKVVDAMKQMEGSIEVMSSDQVLHQIQFLSGMFNLMQSNRQTYSLFLSLPLNRNQLVRFLLTVTQVQEKKDSSLSITSTAGHEEESDVQLKYFPQREASRLVLEKFLISLGSNLDNEVLSDYLCDLKDQGNLSPESLFVLNQILSGQPLGMNDKFYWTHIDTCCHLLRLEAETQNAKEMQNLLRLPRNGVSKKRSAHIVSKTRIILSLKGIICALNSVGDEVCKDSFLKIVYIVVKFCHSCPTISGKLLEILSRKLKYNSTKEMFQDNFFFFSERLNEEYVQFSSVISSPSLARHLRSLFDSCSSGIDDEKILLSLLLLTTSLIDLLDSCYSLKPTFVLQTVLVILEYLAGQDTKKREGCFTSSDKIKKQTFLKIQDFETKWKDFLTKTRAAEQEVEEVFEEAENLEDLPEKEEAEDPEDSWKPKELPIKLKMAQMILERVSKLLSSPEAVDRMIVIQVITKSCLILSVDEDSLLPLVHLLWKQLTLRLTDEDASVARTAFDCIKVLSEVCGDFVRQRMSTDVLPRMISFLTSHSLDAIRTETRIGHQFTITYKYQLEALESIGQIVYGLELQGKNLWRVIQTVLLYVSDDQPKELKEAAMTSLSFIQLLDSDSVWFYCQQNKSSKVFKALFRDN